MNVVTIYEFDTLVPAGEDLAFACGEDLLTVPAPVFEWLEGQCLCAATQENGSWLRLTQRRGHRALQAKSFVGVMRAPDGFQIEVLPKVGKAIGGGAVKARQLLIKMLCCLPGFRHIRTDSAELSAAHMTLPEIFIWEFLRAVTGIVKRGLRNDYVGVRDNLFALRGKLLISPHLRQNQFRADRFFTEHDDFSTNRPENRLLHTALRRVLMLTASQASLKLARELDFIFADVPISMQPQDDFQRVQLDRGMGYYSDALAWARLILDEEAPLTGIGGHRAPSLLFPMEAVFEAFVAKHLRQQVALPLTIKSQARSYHLVRHCEENWFRLEPDLLVRGADNDLVVLDTKWKLLDAFKANGKEKYGLSQGDFYQLLAYGLNYLDGEGDVILVYPKTDAFNEPLPVFEFPKTSGLRLWVLPFCLNTRRLSVPENFSTGQSALFDPGD